MPFTRITLTPDLFETNHQEISTILQQCLETHFDVPSGDCFQIFDVKDSQHIVFDDYYPNLHHKRNESGIFLHIFAGKPRSHDQKRALYQALNKDLTQTLPLEEQDIMIIIQFNQTDDWSFACGISATDL
ncbi:tautomerase family protein [Vibrio natriegens]|uniref:tautomerase family protein n=1 Tax=Vibrio natriegens TaxID=691 RepID=UPI00159498CB|nr:tautomerase family protein [Vibrio natriegens]NVC94079.1 tautomerase family protein [Vibrio natriegens]